jgi:hypothetical protein
MKLYTLFLKSHLWPKLYFFLIIILSFPLKLKLWKNNGCNVPIPTSPIHICGHLLMSLLGPVLWLILRTSHFFLWHLIWQRYQIIIVQYCLTGQYFISMARSTYLINAALPQALTYVPPSSSHCPVNSYISVASVPMLT